MTPPLTAALLIVRLLLLSVATSPVVDAVGSASTLAILAPNSGAASSSIICGILGNSKTHSIQCARSSNLKVGSFPLLTSSTSFDSVSGGRNTLCGLRSGGTALFRWTADANSSSTNRTDLDRKRVYNDTVALREIAVADDQVAATDSDRTFIRWWPPGGSFPDIVHGAFSSLTSGRGFTCAVNDSTSSVQCWGARADTIQASFAGEAMSSIVAGDFHACGITTGGQLICGGSNESGQATAPLGTSAFEFRSLALGSNHTCAVRRVNGTVICWGAGGAGREYTPANSTAFVFIVAGGEITCGLATAGFSVLCWGTNGSNPAVASIPLPAILPGICTSNRSSCSCGPFPNSDNLCSGSGIICNPCDDSIEQPSAFPPAPPAKSSSSSRISRGWLAFAIAGSVGGFAGLCTIIFCIWYGVCRNKKVHNSVQPTISAAGGNRESRAATSSSTGPISAVPSPFTSPNGSKSRIFRRHGSRAMKRQRSGPSSFKDRAEEFSFDDLAAATKNFSSEAKIGAGSFGTVYKGKLPDGREVAIKRSEPGTKTKKFQEKENAFQSELAFLSRLHHKHLVSLVGYCEENLERLLVYEYMKNGALYDHLHPKDVNHSSVLNSWKSRIKVLLDASRGIEYLHNYAVPPIIHRDIKSSNILLDGNWVAKVSDFGLSLLGPESEGEHLSMKAAGTVGYMDPEYYGLHHLTAKSDVYGFGVVMLEVLSGKRAIFKDEETGNPVSIVDHALPIIVAGEIGELLDSRVAPPGIHEAEAVELVAYTAVHCVSREGKERPSMTDIVTNLESALALCEESHASISSASISLASGDSAAIF